jgi:hypothetical protein
VRSRVLRLIALVLVLLGLECIRGGKHTAPYADLEQEIRSNLPVGSTLQEIETYLTTKNISHSYVERENRVYGIVPDVERGLLVSKSLQIVVDLDRQHRLESLELKPVYTGP